MRLGFIDWSGAVLGLIASLVGTAAASPGRSSIHSNFNVFLDSVKTSAASEGIHPRTLAMLDGLSPNSQVIEFDRRQPEFTLTFNRYRRDIVSRQRVVMGRHMLMRYRGVLRGIERRYGVQPRFVVALWGIESNFGHGIGNYPVLQSLATLAWKGRRAAYFRSELIDALKIIDRGDAGIRTLRGSWAGAMGQCQFMPSTYLKYAQDGDGDGRRNIWTDKADALASAANYLAGLGWNRTETWGREIRLPRRFDTGLIGLQTRKSLAAWSRLGIRQADGRALPRRSGMMGSIVRPEAGKGPAFLVYDNFRSIMQWNRSTFFALAVGELADEIARR
jgi:membrane-bound lytic murein transglycosylase B